MKDKYLVAEIATAMRVSKKAVHQRARKQEWPFDERPCRGGMRREYHLSDLPVDVRARLAISGSEKLEAEIVDRLRELDSLVEALSGYRRFLKRQMKGRS